MKCDTCDQNTEFLVFACYDIDPMSANGHPTMARYPMPMIRCCGEHLVEQISKDSSSPSGTNQWVVMRLDTVVVLNQGTLDVYSDEPLEAVLSDENSSEV